MDVPEKAFTCIPLGIAKAGQTKFTVYRHKFSILHAGGWSLFRFQTSRKTRMATGSSLRSPEPHPLIRMLEGVGSKVLYIYSIRSEI